MGIMKTGLRRLRYFMTLSDRLNYRRAADDLGMTQPALSRAIAQLEDDLGVALFERNNRRVALTEAGKVFRDGCREALDALECAVTRTRKTAHGEAGKLVIGYTDIAISGRLAEIVRTFRLEQPEIAVALMHCHTEAQYDLLRSGDIDIGFLTGPVQGTEVDSLLVQTDRFVAILPARHPLAVRSTVRAADLADEPFVLGSTDSWRVFHALLYRLCRESGFEPRVVQRAPDTQGIFGLVACGMGVSIQTENLKPFADERVHVVPIRDCDRPVETFVAWSRSQPRQAVRRFVEHVRAAREPGPSIGRGAASAEPAWTVPGI